MIIYDLLIDFVDDDVVYTVLSQCIRTIDGMVTYSGEWTGCCLAYCDAGLLTVCCSALTSKLYVL